MQDPLIQVRFTLHGQADAEVQMNDIGTMTDREELQPRGEAEARGLQMLVAAILPHQAPAVAQGTQNIYC